MNLKIKVYLLKNIELKHIGEILGDLINFSMLAYPELQKLHMKTGFKYYSFSYLSPIEKDKIYKANEVYEFYLRGKDYNDFVSALKIARNDNIVVLSVEEQKFNIKSTYVENITPAVITIKDGDATRSFDSMKDDILSLKEQIFNNLKKKYISFYDLHNDFYVDDILDDIKLLHKYPIVFYYKNNKMYGYKFKIKFKDNDLGRSFAKFSCMVGIGTKNSSLGCGYCIDDRRIKC